MGGRYRSGASPHCTREVAIIYDICQTDEFLGKLDKASYDAQRERGLFPTVAECKPKSYTKFQINGGRIWNRLSGESFQEKLLADGYLDGTRDNWSWERIIWAKWASKYEAEANRKIGTVDNNTTNTTSNSGSSRSGRQRTSGGRKRARKERDATGSHSHRDVAAMRSDCDGRSATSTDVSVTAPDTVNFTADGTDLASTAYTSMLGPSQTGTGTNSSTVDQVIGETGLVLAIQLQMLRNVSLASETQLHSERLTNLRLVEENRILQEQLQRQGAQMERGLTGIQHEINAQLAALHKGYWESHRQLLAVHWNSINGNDRESWKDKLAWYLETCFPVKLPQLATSGSGDYEVIFRDMPERDIDLTDTTRLADSKSFIQRLKYADKGIKGVHFNFSSFKITELMGGSDTHIGEEAVSKMLGQKGFPLFKAQYYLESGEEKTWHKVLKGSKRYRRDEHVAGIQAGSLTSQPGTSAVSQRISALLVNTAPHVVGNERQVDI